MVEVSNQLQAIIYFLSIFLSGVAFRFVIIRWAHSWARKTETKLDDVIIGAVSKPILIWSFIGGLYVAHPYIGVTIPAQFTQILDKAVLAILILSVSWSVANLVGGVFKYYGHRIGAAVQITSLSQILARLVVLTIGLIIILAEFGVEVTPIVASLGLGGLAIALALQDTLANLFSGFYILAEKSIRVGDFVNVEGAGEGRVTDIGWRTTKIVTLLNSTLVIPNKKLAEAIITNFDLPEQSLGLTTTLSVGFGEDPDKVEAIISDEVSKAVSELEGADPSFKPLVWFAMGEYYLKFTVIFRALDIKYRGRLLHQMNKRLFRRLKLEGVEIPFPVRTLYIRGGQTSLDGSEKLTVPQHYDRQQQTAPTT